jgi:hypothetical protein
MIKSFRGGFMQYIILELIPTRSIGGDIVQLSALKIKNLKLIDRFDYRLNEDKIPYPDLKKIVSYDKDKFIYKENTKEIMKDFKKWSKGISLLILDNKYTYNYVKNLKNEIKYIEKELNMEYSDDIIDIIIDKYKLQPSNYIVDLLYEALIYESK